MQDKWQHYVDSILNINFVAFNDVSVFHCKLFEMYWYFFGVCERVPSIDCFLFLIELSAQKL